MLSSPVKSNQVAICAAALLSSLVAPAFTHAAVQFVEPVLAPMITFDEVPPLTTDPVYSIGGTVVRFGSLFEGQVLGGDPNTLIDSSPDNPLTLSANDPDTATVFDLSNPTMWVLGSNEGTTAFTIPLSIFFEDPVNRVEFDLGHLDKPGTTTIEAYDAYGNILGTFENTKGGLERVALADDSGDNSISGVSVFVQPGEMDWEGFAIDNVSLDQNAIPEPGTLVIWGMLALIAPFCARKRR